MAFQPQNYDVKGQVPMAAIMQAYQNKSKQEYQMKLQAEQQKRQKVQDTLGMINQASQLVQQGVAMSTKRQQAGYKEAVASLLARQEEPVAIGQEPTGELINIPFGETPQFQTALESKVAKAYPNIYAKEKVKGMLTDPTATPTKMQTEKVVIDGKPAIVKKDEQGDYFYRDNTPIPPDTKVEPYSTRDSMVVLNSSDRENQTLIKQAEAVASGRGKLTSFASARSARGQKIAALAMERHPEADMTLFNERNSIRRDFVSGTRGKEAKALDTMIMHADKLLDASEAMGKSNIRKYNKVSNWLKREGKGNPELVKTAMLARGTARETLRVLQGVGVITQQEAMEMKDDLDVNASPAEFVGAVDALFTLSGGRLLTLKSDWDHKMGEYKPPFPIMNKRSKKILERRGYDPETMERKAVSKNTKTGNDLGGGWSFEVR